MEYYSAVWGYSDLCIFPGTRFPVGFQLPEFKKYNWTGDPYTHLKVYIGELETYVEDESLRMLFQKSLTEKARNWFAKLDNTKINGWEDLAYTFLGQFGFQTQVAPNRYYMKRVKK